MAELIPSLMAPGIAVNKEGTPVPVSSCVKARTLTIKWLYAIKKTSTA